MNKALPIIIVLAILGVGAYFFLGRGETAMPSDSVTVSQEETSVGESFTGSLKEAIALGVGMRCTYMFEGNEYEGVVKGENYRGEMVTADGKLSSVIVKDNCMWTWEQGGSQGMTFCTEEVQMDDEYEDSEGSSIWDQPESGSAPDVDYKCSPATVSDSEFTPPSDVEFFDPKSMFGEIDY